MSTSLFPRPQTRFENFVNERTEHEQTWTQARFGPPNTITTSRLTLKRTSLHSEYSTSFPSRNRLSPHRARRIYPLQSFVYFGRFSPQDDIYTTLSRHATLSKMPGTLRSREPIGQARRAWEEAERQGELEWLEDQ